MISIIKELILDFQNQQLYTGIKRHLKYQIIEKKAFVCIGVRRSGKSTFLYQIIEDLFKQGIKKENILYLNFFDDRLNELKTGANLNVIMEAFFSLFPDKKGSEKIYCFFDEIQEIQNWESFVDRILRTENCEVFITGSSSKMLSQEIATQMRGRSITWELFPFSFKEFLDYKETDYQTLTSRNRLMIRNHFDEYFKIGGFPEVRNVSDKIRLMIQQEYYKTILHRDVIERYNAIHPRAVMQAGYRMISSIATLYSLNRITAYLKSIGHKVSKDFVSSCIQWFEDTYFIFSVKIFDLSIAKQNVNAKKAYCIDHSLVISVSPGLSENKGLLLENLIFSHLRRISQRIFYYRTRKGNEVDFLWLDNKDNPNLVQVCFSLTASQTKKRELKAVGEAMQELDINHSIIVTLDEEKEIKNNNQVIQVIPAWKFLLNI
ncbi:MAG: ATP-binding protein [bacterium]